MAQTRQLEARVQSELAVAFSVLREAELDRGSETIEPAALAMANGHELQLTGQPLMGFIVLHVALTLAPRTRRPGVAGTLAIRDLAVARFRALLQPCWASWLR